MRYILFLLIVFISCKKIPTTQEKVITITDTTIYSKEASAYAKLSLIELQELKDNTTLQYKDSLSRAKLLITKKNNITYIEANCPPQEIKVKRYKEKETIYITKTITKTPKFLKFMLKIIGYPLLLILLLVSLIYIIKRVSPITYILSLWKKKQ